MIDLELLENQADEALNIETPETMAEWLLNERSIQEPFVNHEERLNYLVEEYNGQEYCILSRNSVFNLREIEREIDYLIHLDFDKYSHYNNKLKHYDLSEYESTVLKYN